MSEHLSWSELDAWVHGRLDGPREVHLAECGACAERIHALRAEEDVLRAALAPTETAGEDIDGLLHNLPEAVPRAPRAGIVPLLAASVLVGLLILMLSNTRSTITADPMGDAIAADDGVALQRYGRKAAMHVPARAAELRRGPIRVLYAEGESRNEYRMLRPALLKDRDLLVHTMLLNSRDADLYGKSETDGNAPSRFRDIATMFPLSDDDLIQYDVIILGEIDATRLSSSPDVISAAIRSFVKRLGGTLIIIAGPKSVATDVAHAVADLLPVNLADAKATSAVAAVPVEPTQTLRWHLQSPLRPNAKVVLDTIGQRDPLVAERASGRGRVIFVSSDDFWSWGPERQYAFYRDLIGR